MLKKYINLNEWLKTYSFKKKHKMASRNKHFSFYIQVVTLIFCINLSTSIPILQKTNSIDMINGEFF